MDQKYASTGVNPNWFQTPKKRKGVNRLIHTLLLYLKRM